MAASRPTVTEDNNLQQHHVVRVTALRYGTTTTTLPLGYCAVVAIVGKPPAAGRPAGKRGGNNLLAGNTKWIDGQSAGCHDVIACRRHCRPTSSPPTPSSMHRRSSLVAAISAAIGNRQRQQVSSSSIYQ